MSVATLPTIQNLTDPFYSTDANNPASALFVPPTGTYQNNNGQIVPNSTPSSTAQSPLWDAYDKVVQTVAHPSLSSLGSFFGVGSLENVIFIVLGLLLIAAGVFSFDKTQQVIQSAGKIAEVAEA